MAKFIIHKIVSVVSVIQIIFLIRKYIFNFITILGISKKPFFIKNPGQIKTLNCLVFVAEKLKKPLTGLI